MKTSIEEADGIVPDFPPYPLSVSAGGFVFLSGLRGSAPSEVGGFSHVPEAVGARAQGFAAADLMEGRLTCDAWRTHERLNAVLAASRSAGDLILRQHIWQSDKAYFPAYEQVRKTMQPAPAPSSGVGVRSLVANDAGLIGIDGIAACPAEGPEHGPVTITTLPGGRPSTAHYSQSLSYGPLLFLAGHIPIDTRVPSKPLVTTFDALDPSDRFLEMGRSHTDTRQSPIAVQSVFAYREIERHLTELGHAMNDIVHVTVFLQRTSDYAVFHRVHRHFFPSEGPSLTVTGFDEVGHKGTLIEIEPTVLRKGTWKRELYWLGRSPTRGGARRVPGRQPRLLFRHDWARSGRTTGSLGRRGVARGRAPCAAARIDGTSARHGRTVLDGLAASV